MVLYGSQEGRRVGLLIPDAPGPVNKPDHGQQPMNNSRVILASDVLFQSAKEHALQALPTTAVRGRHANGALDHLHSDGV